MTSTGTSVGTTGRRPQMPIEDFEELAHSAPETVTLEFINGKLEVKPPRDGNHAETVMWLLTLCLQQRPDLRLYPTSGLRTASDRNGRARPDGVLAPEGHFVGHGEWSPPDGVLMTVEVTSHSPDTDRRDRHEKRDGYAAAGIPVHLLVDRDATVTVYSEPKNGKYPVRVSHPYGAVVEIPAPVGITLKTEELKEFAR